MANALIWQDHAPQIQPLTTIEELLSWTPSVEEARYCCSIPLPKRRDGGLRADRPRMLCCHDMRGGYLEDRFLQGGGDAGGYFFRHWEKIDGFVYFSHKLVTIPPPGWTHAGHLHGVPVLGTFITEWEEGSEACAAFLASDATAEHAARQLAAIAAFFNFDGWVINIENDVPPSLIPRLLHFLKTLTAAVHALGNRGTVIWYDAVTTEGNLTWQNALTPLNSPFLDACDGIWLNYTWAESAPSEACTAAGDRKYDVYMGIDAFGRGTFGGGGYNCNIALEAARNSDVSVALFACGWPYERHQALCNNDDVDNEEELQTVNPRSAAPKDSTATASKSRRLTAWQVRDDEFWKLIQKSWGLRRATICSTPFYSDFNTGIGTASSHSGTVLSPASWYNLRLQSLQPTIGFLGKRPSGVHARITTAAAYTGGSSIHLSGNLHDAVSVKLFRAAAPVSGQGLRVKFTAAVCRGVNVSLRLRFRRTYSHAAAEEVDEQKRKEELILELLCTSPSTSSSPGIGSSSSGMNTTSITAAPPPAKSSSHSFYGTPTSAATAPPPPVFVQKFSSQTLTTPFSWHPSEDNPNISAGTKYSNTISSTMLPREWSTWQFSVVPGDVAPQGWDLAQSALASIEVTAAPKVPGAGCQCQVYIGAVVLWGMHEEHKAPPTCSPVEDLVVENVAVQRKLTASGGSTAVLSARLNWNFNSNMSSNTRAHVWVRIGTYNKNEKAMQDNLFRSSPRVLAPPASPSGSGVGGGSNNGPELSSPQWVGIACGPGFALSNFVLPEGAEFVRVYIATSAWSFSQPLRSATAVTIPLPFGVTSPKHLHTL
jgi:endo-beta-N-acetylglucosaminidase D